jgi:hypothetical protein
MRVVVAAALCALLFACTDDKAPASRASSAAPVASLSSDQITARSFARALADGLQEGAAGTISSGQADCLTDEIAVRIPSSTLTTIGTTHPDPLTLPQDVRTQLAEAFDVCLPRDVAAQARQKLGLS